MPGRPDLAPAAGGAGTAADVARSWDARADRYLQLFRDELDGKPFDRAVLDDFARATGPGARVCDAGCGPCGHVSAYLARRGADTVGVDLSPRCVELARAQQPDCAFEVADLRVMDLPAAALPLDGLVSYYSLHDQPKALLAGTIAAWGRAVRPGGRLLVVAKEGDSDGVVADPMGSGRPVYWAEFRAAELDAAVSAQFRVDTCQTRDAYADEIPSRRIYLLATRLEAAR
jgi:SAM-dependent methyltransferase